MLFCKIIKTFENKVIWKIYESNYIFNFSNFNSILMGCLVADRNDFFLESVKFSEIGKKNGIGIINIDTNDNKVTLLSQHHI